MAGEFLLHFFEERGEVHVKSNGEADVLCPFEHDKGLETRPSAHVNFDKGVFHCKTCRAEGRFNEGGLSEVGFIASFYNISYTEALKMLKTFDGREIDENWGEAVTNLLGQQELMDYLASRGITKEAVIEYELGYTGTGIIYPVKVNQLMLDKRDYNPWPQPDEPKIKSQRGASALLFPFDHWKVDNRPTLLCAGENDTLLARIYGFNGVTSTFGEGSFPPMFIGLFNGKTVYTCYDCDEAGKKGALQVAFLLRDAGATVYLVDLGLTGTKDDKDLTDFFIKHGMTAADLQERIDNAQAYSGEMYQEAKNEHFPLVNLWDVVHGEYSGKHISSRVQMMGKYDQAMEIPTAIEWACRRPNPDSKICEACPLYRSSGWWTLDDKNLDKVLDLVEVTKEQQLKAINQMIRRPQKCPGDFMLARREKKHVWKVIFSPDVDTEDELKGFRMMEHHAYVVGHDLDDGQRYRAFFRRYPHPKTQAIVSVVDRVEDSDNAINTFKLTEDVIANLTQFQGDPFEQMKKRWELAKRVVSPSSPRMVVEAVNIMYHSVLDFRFAGKMMKGHPEGLVIGESRTGKTETSKMLQQFYGVGNFTNCKGASAAGLMGGVTESSATGHRIRWGTIPRNHMGLVFGDELSGMAREVMATLTYMRSERIAQIEKIASGKAPAKTRIMWISNPRVGGDGVSKPIALYPTGVEVVKDLIGSDEDIARFDFIVTLPPNTVYISPFTEETLEEALSSVDDIPYRQLIYWVWSRRPDQVRFEAGVDKYLWQRSQELNEKFDTNIKFFGPEAYKKLARIAVSIAGMCFSHDGTGETISVQQSHVDWAVDFLTRCYDNSTFRLSVYVERQKRTMTTNEEVNAVFAGLVKGQGMLMKVLSENGVIHMNQLQLMTGLNRDQFGDVISTLAAHGLIENTRDGVMATMRFRLAQDAYMNTLSKQKLIPLSQQGGLPI